MATPDDQLAITQPGARTSWFTADLHLGHARIIELAARPFADLDEMHHTILTRWNERVGETDTVHVLGDVAMGPIGESLELIGQLNGHKILVSGNHDRTFPAYGHRDPNTFRDWVPRYEAAGFASVVTGEAQARRRGRPYTHPLRRSFGGPLVQTVVLSHFPITGESHADRPDRFEDYRPHGWSGLREHWLLHGHVHNAWTVNGRQLNVGVDVWDFTPVPASMVIDVIRTGGLGGDCACDRTGGDAALLTDGPSHPLGVPGCVINGGPPLGAATGQAEPA